MASFDEGKKEIVAWVKENFPSGATCLDVGPCDGKWQRLLGNYMTMDAVEIYKPNIDRFRLKKKYRNVVHANIADCTWDWYDLVIFGDVIEHMPIEQAQKVLKYASMHAGDVIVAVPFQYKQDNIYGNKWETHIQDDLTPEIFSDRYPGFRMIYQPLDNYAYYARQERRMRPDNSSDSILDEHHEPILDIIVTHYNEPWETGRKFFDMLALQRHVDFRDIKVTIIQDGHDGSLPLIKLCGYPYKVDIYSIQQSGVSAARNYGLEHTSAPWITFCDFDDTYQSIYALKWFIQEIRTDKYDLVRGKIYGECMDDYGNESLVVYDEEDIFIHAKMYRRSMLMDNKLRFPVGVTYSEDTVFCTYVKCAVNPARVCVIPEMLYARCYYGDSVTKNPENSYRNSIGVFNGRRRIVEFYEQTGRKQNFAGHVIKTVCDYYYALNYPWYPRPDVFKRMFWEFYTHYYDVFWNTCRKQENLLVYFQDMARKEAVNKGFCTSEKITLWDWIRQMENEFGTAGDKHE